MTPTALFQGCPYVPLITETIAPKEETNNSYYQWNKDNILEVLGHVGMSKDWTPKKREVVKIACIEMKS